MWLTTWERIAAIPGVPMMILKHAFQAAVTVSVRTVDFPLKPSRIVNITLGTD